MSSRRVQGWPLLERDAEMQRIAGHADALAAGGGCVVVEGAPGAGKTALLTEAGERIAARGVRVLTAVGRDLEHDFGFGVARQLLEPVVPDAPAERFEGPASVGRELLTGETGLIEGRADRFGVVHSLYWLVANLAAEGPLALVVDDAQWADPPSLQLIAHVAARVSEIPVLLLVARRPGAEDRWLADLDEICEREHGGRILLEPLSAEGSTALVRELVPDATADLCDACTEATGGNPFLLRELARSLRDVEAPEREAGLIAFSTPRRVAEWLGAQIRRLDENAAALAAALAVSGDQVPLRTVAELAGLSRDETTAAESELTRAGVLRAGRPLRFAHPLLQTAAYEAIADARRSELHRRTADLLAADDGPLDHIAAHLLRCEPAGDAWVAETLGRAAFAAVTVSAPEAAAAYLQRALAEPPPREARAAFERGAGRVAALAGDLPAAIAHLQRARDSARDDQGRAETTLDLASVLALAGDPATGVELLLGSLDTAAASSDLEEAFAVALVNFSRADGTLRHRVDPQRDWVLERAAAPGAAAATLASAAAERSRSAEPGASEQASELALRALRLLGPDAWSPLTDWSPFLAVRVLIVSERFSEAAEILDAAHRSAQAQGRVVDVASILVFKADLGYRIGDLLSAEADARSALALSAASELRMTEVLAGPILADIMLERGDPDAAREALYGGPLGEEAAAHPFSQWVYLLQGRLALATGDPKTAVARAETSGRVSLACGDVNPAVVPWRSDGALAWAAAGDHDAARRLADAELRLAEAVGTPRALGVALRVAGVVHADSSLTGEACAVLEESPARLQLAHALVAHGELVLEHGQTSHAREPLRRALDIAHRCGAVTLADQAHAGLRRSGARPRRRVLDGVEALTPTEWRIAELAARGMSNRAIAQSQFVTTRTVEYHLANAYRKLGVRSRQDLGAALS